jgi:hypothetical protein
VVERKRWGVGVMQESDKVTSNVGQILTELRRSTEYCPERVNPDIA